MKRYGDILLALLAGILLQAAFVAANAAPDGAAVTDDSAPPVRLHPLDALLVGDASPGSKLYAGHGPDGPTAAPRASLPTFRRAERRGLPGRDSSHSTRPVWLTTQRLRL